jgi:hypothetical protein
VFQQLGHEQRARQVYSHACQLDSALVPVSEDVQD